MIAGMAPSLRPGEVVFCVTREIGTARAALAEALAVVAEDEGWTLILPRAAAARLGRDGAPFRRIVLEVHSALEGVGLTAAVATALAADGIACNVVAGAHHDHLFVPADDAARALAALEALAAEERARAGAGAG